MASKKSDIRAGGGYVELSVNADPLEAGLRAAADKLKQWSQELAGLGASFAALGKAITAPFDRALGIFATMGGQIASASRRTGIEFEALGALAYATGGDLQALSAGTRRMGAFLEQAAQGAGTATRALDLLGVSFEELNGMNQEQRFLRIADGLARIGDQGQRDAVARQVLGRGFAEMNLSGGAAGITQRADRARQLGVVMSAADVQTARDYNIAMKEFHTVLNAIWGTIGASIAKYYAEFLRMVTTILVVIKQWIDQNRGLFLSIYRVGEILGIIGVVLGGVSGVILALSGTFTFLAATVVSAATKVAAPVYYLAGAIKGLITLAISFAAAYAVPLLVVAGLVGGLTLLYYSSESAAGMMRSAFSGILGSMQGVGEYFGYLADFIGQTWGGIADALAGGQFELAARIAFLGLSLAWAQTVGMMPALWLAFQDVVRTSWGSTVNYFATAMIYGITALSALWTLGMTGLRAAWAYTVEFFMSTWTRFMTALEVAWIVLKAKMSPLQSQETTDRLVKEAEERGTASETELREHRDTELRRIAAQGGQEMRNLQRDGAVQIANLNRPAPGETAEQRAARQTLDRLVRDGGQGIDEARQELDNANLIAWFQNQLRPQIRQAGGGGPGGFANAGRVGAIGAFGADAIGLFGGESAMRPMERIAERQLQMQTQLVELMSRARMVFN